MSGEVSQVDRDIFTDCVNVPFIMSGEEPKEESEKFNNCINVPNQRTVELLNEIEELKEENRKLKEEVRGLKEKRDDLTEETSFELHEWMQDEVTDLKASFKELMKHTLEVYQRLLEKGISMAKGRSTAERTQLKIEVQKLDDLREKIYIETKKKNQESIRKIKNHLGNPKEAVAGNEAECVEDMEKAEEKKQIVVEEWVSDEQRTLLELKEEVQKIGKLCEKDIVKMTGLIPEIGKLCEQISRDVTAGRKEKEEEKRQLQFTQENKKLIQPFLGSFHYNNPPYTIIIEIKYNEQTGYYEDKYIDGGDPSKYRKSSWTLDGVERDGVGASIEENFLVVTNVGSEVKYELLENGIEYGRRVYKRRK